MKRVSKVFLVATVIILSTLILFGCSSEEKASEPSPTPTITEADKEALRNEIEQVQTTTLTVSGVSVDITADITKTVKDIDKAVYEGDKSCDITLNKKDIISKVKTAYQPLFYQKYDWKTIFNFIHSDGNTYDITDCIVLKYDKSVVNLYLKCCEWSGEYKQNNTGLGTYLSTAIKGKPKYVTIKKNQVVFDDTFIDTFLRKLEKKWDTVGRKTRIECFSARKVVRLPAGESTWGTMMDSAKEKEYLLKMWHKGKSFADREPFLKIDHRGKIKGTRIEVSISNQHVWVYKKGKLINDSPVVTGKDGHSTPKGIFWMSERVPGKWLVGDDYRTWVNRWMRLTDKGVGLHDANWRSNFGGTIYHGSGSHGCVNLPPSFAYWLYPKTYYGEPVIVY